MSRIQTNATALNAHRNLTKTNAALQRSIQKLSSGFRINRASDDAAGLAIANKLRSDVRAYSQTARNGAQAAALLNIADGALDSISSILDRMKELATQAASDNVSNSQRTTLDAEFDELRSEITRIVATTQYQGSVLLNGSFGSTIGGTANSTVGGIQAVNVSGASAGTYTFANTVAGTVALDNGSGVVQTLTGVADQTAATLNFSALNISVQVDSAFRNGTGGNSTLDGLDVTVVAGSGQFLVSASGSYNLNDLVTVSALDAQVTTLGIDGANGDLTSLTNAQTTLTNIDGAIDTVATRIGDLGAAESRIEVAIGNTTTAIENIAAAESVIRDADLAFEMVEFTKNQILQQAGTAMLAQANAAPQSILSLLNG